MHDVLNTMRIDLETRGTAGRDGGGFWPTCSGQTWIPVGVVADRCGGSRWLPNRVPLRGLLRSTVLRPSLKPSDERECRRGSSGCRLANADDLRAALGFAAGELGAEVCANASLPTGIAGKGRPVAVRAGFAAAPKVRAHARLGVLPPPHRRSENGSSFALAEFGRGCPAMARPVRAALPPERPPAPTSPWSPTAHHVFRPLVTWGLQVIVRRS